MDSLCYLAVNWVIYLCAHLRRRKLLLSPNFIFSIQCLQTLFIIYVWSDFCNNISSTIKVKCICSCLWRGHDVLSSPCLTYFATTLSTTPAIPMYLIRSPGHYMRFQKRYGSNLLCLLIFLCVLLIDVSSNSLRYSHKSNQPWIQIQLKAKEHYLGIKRTKWFLSTILCCICLRRCCFGLKTMVQGSPTYTKITNTLPLPWFLAYVRASGGFSR